MEIVDGQIIRHPGTENARGGTELLGERLARDLNPELLKDIQIIFSRTDKLLEDKVRILYLHDLAGDPASDKALQNGKWQDFHRLIFVSNWQMQAYCAHYSIPYSKCLVIKNSVEPIEAHVKPKEGRLRLAYWSTPHRGLDLLYPVFDALSKKYDHVDLSVYSSFKLYGWDKADGQFEPLFEQLRSHPRIDYHESVPNEVIREDVKNFHILAYPCTWVETSCLVLMEAMSAGLMCVHPNLGALYETGANWTTMYQYTEDRQDHAQRFFQLLSYAIENYDNEYIQSRLASQKTYADVFYNWKNRIFEWEGLLRSDIRNEPRSLNSKFLTLKTG